jgi:acetyl-CoA acetyltransferase family protein
VRVQRLPHGHHGGEHRQKYEFSRAEQDLFAATSQQRTAAAQSNGHFDSEIIPIEIPQRKGDPLIFAKDEFPRAGTTAETLAKLKPAFKKDGTVTAGNASGINDGAAGVVVMSGAMAKQLGLQPIARVVSFGSAGVDPAIMGTGPIPAVRKCLDRAGWSAKDLDMIEANEAFAAQAMSVNKELGFRPGECQRQRRRDFHRPPDRRIRRTDSGHAAVRHAAHRRQQRSRYPVYRWRSGRRPGSGKNVIKRGLKNEQWFER